MKKKSLVLVFILFAGMQSFAQFEGAKQTYSAPNLKTELAKQKLVAILPFDAAITYKRTPKNYDSSANRNEEMSISKNLQQSMFTYLLRKADKYTVSFQDVNRTNALLKSKDIYSKLDILTADSICKILGVDAVIKCNYAYEKTASEAGAIVKTILIGGMGSKTGSGALTMQIYNGADGNLLWRFYKAMNDDVMSSTDKLMERMMRKVSRNFPYEK
ncbi:MAG TPA: hypothetical protein VGW31_13770 [Hanamia sp.]|nr:hypothetical protein [Hanamia sp.]